MSVEWNELMKIWELEEWEVLQVVRSSDTRRFQIQVTRPDGPEAWKGLPWKPYNMQNVSGSQPCPDAEGKHFVFGEGTVQS